MFLKTCVDGLSLEYSTSGNNYVLSLIYPEDFSLFAMCKMLSFRTTTIYSLFGYYNKLLVQYNLVHSVVQ